MDNKKSFSFLKLLLGAYVCVGIVLLLTNNLIFDLSLNSVLITGIFVLCSVVYGVLHKNKKNVMAGGTVAVIYIILAVVCSPIISYNSHRNLIGNIHEVDFSSEIQYIDLNQLPTIDKELAEKLADKKLGEIASLGSQVYVGTLELQNINGELYYVAPLEHSSLFKWFTNRKGTAGYIKVSATNQNDVQLVTQLDGKDLAIKYLDSSYLFSNLRRAAFFRDMKAGHTDYTFELDDNGKPHWVVTRYDNAVGIAETKAVGALIMDAQSGESQVYNIDNLPSWVDRIQPSTYIKRYIDKWGELVHGIFNFSDKDKLKTTSGMNVIYNNDTCYYYTGITSVGSDESLVGFTLTNTRSGETKLYKTAGATESASMKSAEGKVQQYGYTATFPYLINIQNEPTYFMTLKDSSGLVKQYAMVNVKNYNTVGVGDTLQSTLNKYLEGLTNTNISLEGGSKEETVLGEVERIGVIVKEGTSIYDVKLKGTDNIFSISTEMSREVALTSVGDSVSVKYINVGNSKYVITNYFENVSLSSTEANKEVEKTQE
ncbi:cell shape-determining protein [Clostridium botulinum]|uniref:cell shape-determining protein n=1 Tax=unclassified Clostridium TaxID=2614128 RepID=UPI0013CA013F|nr:MULTISPECIES: cell shape-determining protein [unclassified Clostridium]MBY7006563.1 cell shape-determining protein [Clostridium botulinum]NFH71266.1 cell shape-determining protein [Clostridium botulinum]NFH99742.1 cell shape-determining protein [Clostridium botulinum]NFI61923.1 cell shape-determining protein [Clostridium botulinum]NFI79569.1 cell shape-determining protein [Clostridium botulinum]